MKLGRSVIVRPPMPHIQRERMLRRVPPTRERNARGSAAHRAASVSADDEFARYAVCGFQQGGHMIARKFDLVCLASAPDEVSHRFRLRIESREQVAILDVLAEGVEPDLFCGK